MLLLFMTNSPQFTVLSQFILRNCINRTSFYLSFWNTSLCLHCIIRIYVIVHLISVKFHSFINICYRVRLL